MTIRRALHGPGRLRPLIAVGALATGALVAFSPSAGAATFDGALGIHGPGSLFAGSAGSLPPSQLDSAFVALVIAPGATATFPVEVVNKGTALSQYRIIMVPEGPPDTSSLLVGSADVTSLAESVGYVTSAIAPAKTQALSLKIKVPASAIPADSYDVDMELESVDGTVELSQVLAYVSIKANTGTTDHDVFATSSGQGTVLGSNDFDPVTIAAPTMKTNATASFTVTVKNDASDTTAIGLEMDPVSCAPGSWIVTAKVGTTDVTSQLIAGTYVTPALTTGKSVKVTVTVKAIAPVPDTVGCTDWEYNRVIASAADGSSYVYTFTDTLA